MPKEQGRIPLLFIDGEKQHARHSGPGQRLKEMGWIWYCYSNRTANNRHFLGVQRLERTNTAGITD